MSDARRAKQEKEYSRRASCTFCLLLCEGSIQSGAPRRPRRAGGTASWSVQQLSDGLAAGWHQNAYLCASRRVRENRLPRWTSKVSPSSSPLRSRFHGRGNHHGSGAARGGAIRRQAPPRHPPGGAWPNPRGRLFARLSRRAPAALGGVVREAAASLSRQRPSSPRRLRWGRRASRTAGAGGTRQRRCRRALPGQAARRRAAGPHATASDRRSALFAASARGTLRRRRRLCGAATAPLPPDGWFVQTVDGSSAAARVGRSRLQSVRPTTRLSPSAVTAYRAVGSGGGSDAEASAAMLAIAGMLTLSAVSVRPRHVPLPRPGPPAAVRAGRRARRRRTTRPWAVTFWGGGRGGGGLRGGGRAGEVDAGAQRRRRRR